MMKKNGKMEHVNAFCTPPQTSPYVCGNLRKAWLQYADAPHLDLLEGLTCWGEFLKVDCRKSKSLHLRWILAISVYQIPPIHTRSVEPHTVVVAGGGRWDLAQVHMGRASSRTLRSCWTQRLRIGYNPATWIRQELNMESIATTRFRLA